MFTARSSIYSAGVHFLDGCNYPLGFYMSTARTPANASPLHSRVASSSRLCGSSFSISITHKAHPFFFGYCFSYSTGIGLHQVTYILKGAKPKKTPTWSSLDQTLDTVETTTSSHSNYKNHEQYVPCWPLVPWTLSHLPMYGGGSYV